jgi:hypothetical protein
VWGAGDHVLISAPGNRALAEATRVLGLSPIVTEAASSCLPDTVCDHLVVDGFDLYFTAEGVYRRLTIRERNDF